MRSSCVVFIALICAVQCQTWDNVKATQSNATMETRLLEQLSRLSEMLDNKMEFLSSQIEELKVGMSDVVRKPNGASINASTADGTLGIRSSPSAPTGLDSQSVAEIDAKLNTTQKSLDKLSQQLLNFSLWSTQRSSLLEQESALYFMRPVQTYNAVSFVVSRDLTDNHGFGANWIVFQRRFNGSVGFYRNWTEYENGFGDLRGEHWLGLSKLHAILATRQHELLIVLEDFEGVIAYAHYDDFQIGNASEKYAIKSVGVYQGTAGDSFSQHKDEKFSTYDQDNDKHTTSCADWARGAWWFYKCFRSHLNGEYLTGKQPNQHGIAWVTFRDSYYSLKKTKMMVRPLP
ncbi:microfibril-associated glycoprotein 4-like [Anopheles nili]|uniref:microfibril-associated glycoprotein 4-like n=1 Tax=Anopheles nili TaxID=185578 RepID=UPI00237B099F|nr:microfibril-associated glycoprotein 4-like [Anopheles nili]